MRSVRPDQLVSGDAAREQLPVEARDEAARTLRARGPARARRAVVTERSARGGVLVLGGGFAGAYVARLLGNRGATIVSPENFMLYTPPLPPAPSRPPHPPPAAAPPRALRPPA